MNRSITFPERVVEADALAALPELLQRHELGQQLILVCDDTTWLAAGQQVVAILADAVNVTAHSVGGKAPRPLLAHCGPLMAVATANHATGLIAVGSGTVNDITKCAAHQLGLPYICVATAASMNGYSSANASLIEDDHKHSYPATMPRAVVVDMRIITAAPRRLARAGLGDTLCRGTVAADRYISHLVHGTPFERELFERLRVHEAVLMARPEALREGDSDYLHCLMTALLDAGDAMSAAGSSAVASQGEHMIAHTAELFYEAELRDVMHGELIAVTTVTMAQLQHKILLGTPLFRALPRDEAQFKRMFGKSLGEQMILGYEQKLLTPNQADGLNRRMETEWPDIKAELLAMVPPPSAIERALMQAGLATKAKGIGLYEDRYNSAFSYAYMTRERFTFLDVAVMTTKRA